MKKGLILFIATTVVGMFLLANPSWGDVDDDVISGGAGSDVIREGAGDDTIYGEYGSGGPEHSDVPRGGTGDDTLYGYGGHARSLVQMAIPESIAQALRSNTWLHIDATIDFSETCVQLKVDDYKRGESTPQEHVFNLNKEADGLWHSETNTNLFLTRDNDHFLNFHAQRCPPQSTWHRGSDYEWKFMIGTDMQNLGNAVLDSEGRVEISKDSPRSLHLRAIYTKIGTMEHIFEGLMNRFKDFIKTDES